MWLEVSSTVQSSGRKRRLRGDKEDEQRRKMTTRYFLMIDDIYMAMLSRYYDMDMGYGYGDTPIRHFSKNNETRIHRYMCYFYIYRNI